MAETFGLQLVSEGLVGREQLYEALRRQRRTGRLLGTCLLELGAVRRGPLLQALARHLGMPPAPPSQVLNPDPGLARAYDPSLLRRLRAVPFRRGVGGRVEVAFADPRLLGAVKALRDPDDGSPVILRVAVQPDVDEALSRLFGPETEAAGDDGPPSVRTRDARPAGDGRTEGLRPPRVVGPGAEITVPLFEPRPAPADGPVARDEAPPAERTEARSGEPVAPVAAPVAQAPSASAPPLPLGESARPDRAAGAGAAEAGVGPRLDNAAEVEFARALGFDRARTAVFRLDPIAEQERLRSGIEARRGLSEHWEGEEGELIPAPPGAPRLAEAAERLFEARNEGILAREVVRYYAAFFPRVLLLARHGESLRGILGHGLGLSGPEVAALRVPASGVDGLFERGLGYYGPPPGGRELEPLYEALREVAVTALLLPIETRQPPAWLVYADHGPYLTRYAEVHDLEMMAKEVAIALDLLRGKQP